MTLYESMSLLLILYTHDSYPVIVNKGYDVTGPEPFVSDTEPFNEPLCFYVYTW